MRETDVVRSGGSCDEVAADRGREVAVVDRPGLVARDGEPDERPHGGGGVECHVDVPETAGVVVARLVAEHAHRVAGAERGQVERLGGRGDRPGGLGAVVVPGEVEDVVELQRLQRAVPHLG